MRAGWKSAVAAVALLVVLPVSSARSQESVCGRFGEGTVSGNVKSTALTEISGLVASRAHHGVYWTHNDSGGNPEVFALRLDGSDLGRYPFQGAQAVDWEDFAIGPKLGAPGWYLYAADIGNNNAAAPMAGFGTARTVVSVYRAPEPHAMPKAPGAPIGGVERFDLVYPAGPEDAEAMVVDPISGDLVIITKVITGMSRVLTAPAASLVHGATITMVDHGTIQVLPPVSTGVGTPGTWVTGADISPDGALILVRTYRSILAFDRRSGESVPDALTRSPCFAPQTEEMQGEAVAIAHDESRYVTIGEGTGQPINVFGIARDRPRNDTSPSPSTTAITRVAGETLPRTGAAQLGAGLAGALVVRYLKR